VQLEVPPAGDVVPCAQVVQTPLEKPELAGQLVQVVLVAPLQLKQLGSHAVQLVRVLLAGVNVPVPHGVQSPFPELV
jgi:hypothetical protein